MGREIVQKNAHETRQVLHLKEEKIGSSSSFYSATIDVLFYFEVTL